MGGRRRAVEQFYEAFGVGDLDAAAVASRGAGVAH